MPPALPDSPVGRASNLVGSRKTGDHKTRNARTSRSSQTIAGALRPDPLSRGHLGPEGGARASRHEALESLLIDLGPQIRSAAAYSSSQALADSSASSALDSSATPTSGESNARRFHATGIQALDTRLGGGFPVGRLSEICGASPESESEGDRDRSPSHSTLPTCLSAGRTSLALGLLAETLGTGVLAAWIDLADAFDPEAALTAILERGGEASDLDRLLWIRARDEDEALRCCEHVMRTDGFELVVFDAYRLAFQQAPVVAPSSSLSSSPPTSSLMRPPARRPMRQKRRNQGPRIRVKDVTWLRLARLAAGTRTSLIALSEQASTGSRAEMILELQAHAIRFTEPPHLLETLETRAVLRRHRSRPPGDSVALSVTALPSSPSFSDDPEDPEELLSEEAPSKTSMRRAALPPAPVSRSRGH